MGTGWILVVEDEVEAREVLCDTLDVAGCKAIGAPDGREAQQRLESSAQPPCVIVLDLMMPRMNGWEFRRWQLGVPRLAAVPVLLMSANRDLGAEAGKLEVAEFLPKPVQFDVLLERVQRFCGPCREPAPPGRQLNQR